MGVSEIPLEYDLAMTYIASMETDDGLIIGADGLMRQFRADTGEELKPLQNAQKLFPINSHVVAGFAGPFNNLTGFVRGYKTPISPLGLRSVQEIAKSLCPATTAHYSDLIKKYGKEIEIIVAGYDLGENDKPLEARLYYFKSNSGLDPLEFGDFVDAGFKEEVTVFVRKKFEKSPKDYKSIKQVAVDAIVKSSSLFSKDVGGNISISHITKSGISTESIR